MPADIRWHFIGNLQSNKVNQIAGKLGGTTRPLQLHRLLARPTAVRNLVMVETVDSIKLANKLNQALSTAGRSEPLDILVQVNTSGEDGECKSRIIHTSSQSLFLSLYPSKKRLVTAGCAAALQPHCRAVPAAAVQGAHDHWHG
jgi:uncharacterized pyridoxal phosphate-containing UPF0001 family protein